ncbi:GNAT family N-acetyltransferase [Shewanella goraebulensis]|uniref:GNAT family N-acetyltransferase n=1 Tax=Shewanella goraebulensis TaxID=3050637 RepID=UPI00254E1C2C|nr:GNAT family N-acetyltransferase [Shewanella goraebulensis]
MHEFETERLSMRLLKAEDKEFFTGLYCDPKTMKLIAKPLTEEQSNVMFERSLTHIEGANPKELIWVIRVKATQEIIGIQNLFIFGKSPEDADAGLILTRTAHGKGYPNEATAAVMDYGLKNLGIRTFHTNCSARNYAIQRVIRAMGFVESTESSDEQVHYFKNVQ